MEEKLTSKTYFENKSDLSYALGRSVFMRYFHFVLRFHIKHYSGTLYLSLFLKLSMYLQLKDILSREGHRLSIQGQQPMMNNIYFL